MKTQSNNKRKFVESDVYNIVISFNENPIHTEECDMYEYDVVYVQKNELSYSNIVSTIIRDQYSDDKMQAIINNYLLDGSDEHVFEFNELQSWRKQAKEVAKKVLENL